MNSHSSCVRSLHPTLVTSTKVSLTSSQHVVKITPRPASHPIFIQSPTISEALAFSSSTAAAACLVFCYISSHRTHLCLQLYTLQNCCINGKATDDSLKCFVLIYLFIFCPSGMLHQPWSIMRQAPVNSIKRTKFARGKTNDFICSNHICSQICCIFTPFIQTRLLIRACVHDLS